jgi:hypothetical protein
VLRPPTHVATPRATTTHIATPRATTTHTATPRATTHCEASSHHDSHCDRASAVTADTSPRQRKVDRPAQTDKLWGEVVTRPKSADFHVDPDNPRQTRAHCQDRHAELRVAGGEPSVRRPAASSAPARRPAASAPARPPVARPARPAGPALPGPPGPELKTARAPPRLTLRRFDARRLGRNRSPKSCTYRNLDSAYTPSTGCL